MTGSGFLCQCMAYMYWFIFVSTFVCVEIEQTKSSSLKILSLFDTLNGLNPHNISLALAVVEEVLFTLAFRHKAIRHKAIRRAAISFSFLSFLWVYYLGSIF